MSLLVCTTCVVYRGVTFVDAFESEEALMEHIKTEHSDEPAKVKAAASLRRRLRNGSITPDDTPE